MTLLAVQVFLYICIYREIILWL